MIGSYSWMPIEVGYDKLKKRSSVKQGKNRSIVPTGFTGNYVSKAVLLI